ncbi:MAG: P1 family peptidase [Thermoplasmata archaeon]|nr:P1 family peptidase [Thermoplasmata archaeon]
MTVALFHPPAAVVVDVRGGASCTYDTASLSVEATFGRRWGLFFAGGSVHGLDAARGIRTALLSQGDGQRPFSNPNRIVQVSGATLFDLPPDEGPIADYLPLGFEAVEQSSAWRVAVGRVGAGAGATVGKYLGKARGMPGGLGYADRGYGALGAAAALVVLNSVGAVRDADSGRWLAGARGVRGRVVPPQTLGTRPVPAASRLTRGTNLVLVVTEAPLDRSGLFRLAVQAHDGLARAVVPSHTATDGDVVFAATTGAAERSPQESYPGATADQVGARVAALVAEAAVVAVRP